MERTLILTRYIIREISKPLAAICGLLAIIFASYSALRLLNDPVVSLLPAPSLAAIIGLRTIIALELLLPMAFYLSVVAGLGRLYSDSEMVALWATGSNPGRVWRAVGYAAVALAVLVTALSVYARPWAYRAVYDLEARAEVELNPEKFLAGRFVELPEKKGVMFANAREGAGRWSQGVFVQRELEHNTRVIFAREAYARRSTEHGRPVMVFRHGRLYDIDRTGHRDRVVSFRELTLERTQPTTVSPHYSRKAVPTWLLARSNTPREISELQWRLSAPLSTLLLGLAAVPLSRANPRSGKYAKLGVAVVVYALYYSALIMARSWVKDAVIAPMPGIWWVPALLAGAIAVVVLRPWMAGRR
ncbi:MAG: LPS export ABC transporter permease LptF [Gammaproteobacteria bacterium]|nr:LPS export ABC transporter permease LptF [Gammaproteobacteria bacterium]NIV73967.1 LPS export ABC transporter permease LptF [Gammaproteobacteria bacterium]